MADNNECLICGAPLEYLQTAEEMECAVCHEREASRARCENGHYVCDECHTRGLDLAMGICEKSASRNPLIILDELMRQPFCHMHGPEHHVLVGAALLAAYKNAGGAVDLESALPEMFARGRQVPGGTCGFWGACGAGISSGIFAAIVTESDPLKEIPWGLSNRMTAEALFEIGSIGGPRCCKRDSYLALQAAVDFARRHLGVEMETAPIVCGYSAQNPQCIGDRCPFGQERAAGGMEGAEVNA